MAGPWGINLFALSFPPTHRVKMVFATKEVRVILGEGEDEEGLKGFLQTPPVGFLAFLRRVFTYEGKIGEDMGLEPLGWEGVRLEFPSGLSRVFSTLKSLWFELTGRVEAGPFSYRFSVERKGRVVAETTLSLFRGGDMTTLVDPKAESQDLAIHLALIGCLFLVWGRLTKELVTLVGRLESVGVVTLL